MSETPAATPKPQPTANVAIGLNAVLASVERGQPCVLCVETDDGFGLPYGPFNPGRHRTFEIGMREWVERQTNVALGYIEQLYTFGDEGREAPAAALDGRGANDRIVSVGYLGLAHAPAAVDAPGAGWRNWYSFFPWEDWRGGAEAIIEKEIAPRLAQWGQGDRNRRIRIDRAFGFGEFSWEEERAIDRYEVLYEAGLVIESARDRGRNDNTPLQAGLSMISDHRRILATAIGRLRGKLKYRPILFEIMPPQFTLLELQRTVEAIVGFTFHKQNFRRSIEKSGFVEPTGHMRADAPGRPAALFQVNKEALKDRAAGGLSIPRRKT